MSKASEFLDNINEKIISTDLKKENNPLSNKKGLSDLKPYSTNLRNLISELHDLEWAKAAAEDMRKTLAKDRSDQRVKDDLRELKSDLEEYIEIFNNSIKALGKAKPIKLEDIYPPVK